MNDYFLICVLLNALLELVEKGYEKEMEFLVMNNLLELN